MARVVSARKKVINSSAVKIPDKIVKPVLASRNGARRAVNKSVMEAPKPLVSKRESSVSVGRDDKKFPNPYVKKIVKAKFASPVRASPRVASALKTPVSTRVRQQGPPKTSNRAVRGGEGLR